MDVVDTTPRMKRWRARGRGMARFRLIFLVVAMLHRKSRLISSLFFDTVDEGATYRRSCNPNDDGAVEELVGETKGEQCYLHSRACCEG